MSAGLVESHDLGFVSIQLEAGPFTPFLALIYHGLEFFRAASYEA
jgi:hypothetical protein